MAMQVWEVGEYMLATVYQICGNTFANMYPPASHT